MADQTQQSSQLPTGTVTFLFTDIEGSTSAWIRNPTAMRAALARHDALIETTVTHHAGQVVRPRAEDVCTTPMLASSDVLDVLSALVDKSLVVAERGAAQMRYRLLETIREYASERLAGSGRASEVRRRHMAYYRTLVEGGALTRRGVRYAKDFDVLKRERDNTRAALTASLALGDLEDGLALCQGLAGFWLSQGFLNEGQGWFERFLESAVEINWATLVESLFAAGRLAEYRGAFDVARSLHQRSLSVARQHDDVTRAARALNGLGDTALHQGDHEEAARCLEEGIRSVGESQFRPILQKRWWLSQPLLTRAESTTAPDCTSRKRSRFSDAWGTPGGSPLSSMSWASEPAARVSWNVHRN